MDNIFSLSSIGFSNYSLSIADGVVIRQKPNKKRLKHDNEYRISMVADNGKHYRKTLKSIYRELLDVEYSIDLIEDLQGELWKPIIGTQMQYFVSNYGRIKSYKHYNAIILKPYISDQRYPIVDINGVHRRVHCIVAQHFCENPYKPDQITEVHHIDLNPSNPKADNLIILTPKEHRELHKQLREARNEELLYLL